LVDVLKPFAGKLGPQTAFASGHFGRSAHPRARGVGHVPKRVEQRLCNLPRHVGKPAQELGTSAGRWWPIIFVIHRTTRPVIFVIISDPA
jgi:hypothetical protein